MNRIRKYNNIFQVLITPPSINTPFEVLLNNWSDEIFFEFYIKEYITMGEAQEEAYNYPDIDWNKLTLIHLENYKKININLSNLLSIYKFNVEYEAILQTPIRLKENIFNRVMNDGKRFALLSDLNDIISFNIINPWSKKIEEIANIITQTKELNIINKFSKSKVIYLIGRTDIGTTYEIRLWPTIIYQWSKFVENNKDNKNIERIGGEKYKQSLELQDYIDNKGNDVRYD